MKRTTTRIYSKKWQRGWGDDAVAETLRAHAQVPGYNYAESVMDDGEPRFSKQKCVIRLFTRNKWAEGFYPFHEPTVYQNPSFIECFWEPDALDAGAEELQRLLEVGAEGIRVFYAWAGMCYAVGGVSGPRTGSRAAVKAEVVEALTTSPYADMNDGDNIDYRDVVRGAFWFNFLGPGHLRRLGGQAAIGRLAKDFSPVPIGEDYMVLTLRDAPLLEPNKETFDRHAALAR